MNRRALRATAAAATIFSTLFIAVAWLKPAPRYIWNASASAPTGLYRVDGGAPPRLGDFVALDPPPALGTFLAQRGYLPRDVPLLKRVAGLPGALVCRSGVFVTVNGVAVARALARDRANRQLPVWTGCRIVGRGELFLVNAARDSLDGRYFGPVSAAGLLGTAHPILTRTHPAAALRWGSAEPDHAPSLGKKETSS
ncbi:conjugative transfer signal peptidase TraF [Sphingopyxis italica]|uniref:Conjugative transfer signal peptidase TraF n=1 Tax=Sphingopyxis italica TaxID=1129133 RepID=A0A7X5XRF5_9SPHN|nr:S26 family signal peptidase [Sphingopyxis italica]NJB88567.1 conjugative transfer signal peptidase TraF [Sphingopyxis italica]